MTRVMVWLPFAALIVLANGCATQRASWASTDQGDRSVQVGGYAIDLPGGWMRLKGEPGETPVDRQILSRDGTNLQIIEVTRATLAEAFPRLKRGAPAGALPSELAELQLADVRTIQGLANANVARNEPITVAGTNGFLLDVSFKNGRGLRYERIIVGFADSESYYTLTYQAPVLHYFARDRATFDALLRSLRPAPRKSG